MQSIVESAPSKTKRGNPYRDANGRLTSKDKAVYDIRHLPGKHNQKDHAGKKSGPGLEVKTGPPPNDQSKWAFEQDKDLNIGAKRVLAYSDDFDDPVSRPLVGIAKRQGFDAKPTRGSVDDELAAGGIEIHRGMSTRKGTKDTTSGDQIHDKFMNGDYEPGTGNYGNGYYFSTESGIAKMYADAPIVRGGYNAKKTEGGKVVRAALKRDAKVVYYEDIQEQHKEWWKSNKGDVELNPYRTDFIIPKDKISPTAFDAMNDPGHFAALMGYDAIVVPLKNRPTDRRNKANIQRKIGSNDLGDEIVVLNRGALVVDE